MDGFTRGYRREYGNPPPYEWIKNDGYDHPRFPVWAYIFGTNHIVLDVGMGADVACGYFGVSCIITRPKDVDYCKGCRKWAAAVPDDYIHQ
ncbi:MAG: hypothetical protein MPK62_01195 [Alphaproteobacteria bacterium]|nr:hypothetical protein [Alphaproteobacteria bacterium]MDA8029751.1 hypothetical protein [Alphaproteobacteria bacterium]